MTRAIFFTGALAAGLAVGAARSAELTELPEGPDRELVAKVCQSCHDLKMVFDATGFSRADWDSALEEMTANGMNISADDREKILVYLATFLGPAPPKAASGR